MATKAQVNKLHKQLTDVFAPLLDTDTYTIVQSLIQNAAFMAASLKDLQGDILQHGYVETYQNGENQYGLKESVYVKAYNTILRNYNVTIKSLISYLPAERKQEVSAELQAFLNG